MAWLIQLMIILICAALAYEDFSQRRISWWWLPVLFMLLLINGISSVSFAKIGTYFLLNISFLLLQFLLVSIYFSLKEKRMINIIDRYIGLGDILMFVVVCISFHPVIFILFYIATLLLTLLVYGIYTLLRSKALTIPLVSSTAIGLAFLLIMLMVFPYYNLFIIPENLTSFFIHHT
jgi:hypothetical protein